MKAVNLVGGLARPSHTIKLVGHMAIVVGALGACLERVLDRAE